MFYQPLGMPIHTPMFSLFNNPAAICESAASLLLMNVKWAKNVPSFTSLPMSDQLLLLEESWRELFVLGAAQFLAPLDLGPVIQHCGALDSSNEEKVSTFLVEVRDFQETLEKLVNFQVISQLICMTIIFGSNGMQLGFYSSSLPRNY